MTAEGKATDRKAKEADRKIYFFRPDAGTDADRHLVKIEPTHLLKKLKELPFKVEGGRYLEQADGNYLCAWVDSIENVGRMRFALIRRNGIPQSESGGQLRNLLLGADEGLCETAHVCFFPEGIIGIEFNFFGPRPQRLGHYFFQVLGSHQFTMEALIRRDIAEQFSKKRALRRLTLRVRRSAIDQVAEADESLGDALNAALRASDAECIGVIFEPEPYQKSNLRDSLMNTIRRLLALPGIREDFRQFEVSAVDDSTNRVDTLNLLDDKLIKAKSILRLHERSRVLDTDDAYSKIEEAFMDLRKDLLSAMSANVVGE